MTTTTNQTTMHANLLAHMLKHAYKRGKYKGDAPADASNRGKSHFRVSEGRYGGMAVIFHDTQIITAQPDGTISINMGGYEDSPTTKAAYHHAMVTCGTFVSYLGSVKQFGLSQTCITAYRPIAGQKTYLYYRGMRFDIDGNLLTDPIPFRRRGIDKEASKAFAQGMKESGFTTMFPLLFATAEKPNKTEWVLSGPGSLSHHPRYGFGVADAGAAVGPAVALRFHLTNPDRAEFWPTLVVSYKYFGFRTSMMKMEDTRTRSECWAVLMEDAKRDLYKITDTDVTSI